MFHLSLFLDLKRVIVLFYLPLDIAQRSCVVVCPSVSVLNQDRDMPFKSSHPPHPPCLRVCLGFGEAGWKTPKPTPTPDDIDMPYDTPTGATTNPTTEETGGCYINTQRDVVIIYHDKICVHNRPYH